MGAAHEYPLGHLIGRPRTGAAAARRLVAAPVTLHVRNIRNSTGVPEIGCNLLMHQP
jgi:hypothetical protein